MAYSGHDSDARDNDAAAAQNVKCCRRGPTVKNIIRARSKEERQLNGYGTLHGGAVGSLAEVLSTACARTVVTEDRELFLGGISISYLSGTPLNEEVLLANASVVKTGRNLTVVALEFKLKKNGNLLFTTNATFYNMPVSSL